MATSQPTEIQAEGEVDVNEAVKEILAEMEAEEQDPLEGMGNAQIAEIYHRMKLLHFGSQTLVELHASRTNERCTYVHLKNLF